jgi:hypothetical protein
MNRTLQRGRGRVRWLSPLMVQISKWSPEESYLLMPSLEVHLVNSCLLVPGTIYYVYYNY